MNTLTANIAGKQRLLVQRAPNAAVVSKRIQTSAAQSWHHQQAKERSSGLQSCIAWYSKKLDTHPLMTKAITSGVIAGAGDFMCQCATDKPEKEAARATAQLEGDVSLSSQPAPLWWWDGFRTGRFAALGAFLIGPVCHYWYTGLAAQIPGDALATIAKRVAWDQLVFTPAIFCVWFPSFWELESMGDSYRGTRDSQKDDERAKGVASRLGETLPGIMVANWMLWVPIQGFNFKMVPVKFQVLFVNVVALGWNSFLSYTTSRPSPIAAEVPEAKEEIITQATALAISPVDD